MHCASTLASQPAPLLEVSDIDMGKKMAAFTYDLLVELRDRLFVGVCSGLCLEHCLFLYCGCDFHGCRSCSFSQYVCTKLRDPNPHSFNKGFLVTPQIMSQ